MHNKKIGVAILLIFSSLQAQEAVNPSVPKESLPATISSQNPEPVVMSADQSSAPALQVTPASSVSNKMQARATFAQPMANSTSAQAIPLGQNQNQVIPNPQPVTEQLTPVTQPVGATVSPQVSGNTTAVSQPVPNQPLSQPINPPVPEAAQIASLPSQDDLEINAIDNSVSISEGKGNWLYKRIWWEKAERLYEKTKQMADRILESRLGFYARRTDIDRMLQEFYVNIGLQQGELLEAINFYNKEDTEIPNQELSETEKTVITTIAEQKKNLQALQGATVAISKIDNALDDALMKLSEQLNLVKQYEQQSWQAFKEINKELNDKKARELYYAMDTFWKNINTINSYLTDPFSKYFDQLTQKLQQDIESVKMTVQLLSQKGINLKTQFDHLTNGTQESDAKPETEPQASAGIFGTIWQWLTYPFVAIGNALSSLFGGSDEEVVVAAPRKKNTVSEVDSE
jgi:hypothetical protein